MSDARLVIIGDGPVAALAQSIAARTRGGTIEVAPLTPDRIADSTLPFLDAFDPADSEAFAAIGLSALNFARFDLWAKLRLKGFRCASLVDPSAVVDPSARLADNILIGAQAVVGANASVGSGSIVQAGACLAESVILEKFGWIEQGVTIGARAKVGAHVVLASGVHLADGVELGGSNEVSVPGRYRGSIPYGTFIAPEFGTPVVRVHHV